MASLARVLQILLRPCDDARARRAAASPTPDRTKGANEGATSSPDVTPLPSTFASAPSKYLASTLPHGRTLKCRPAGILLLLASYLFETLHRARRCEVSWLQYSRGQDAQPSDRTPRPHRSQQICEAGVILDAKARELRALYQRLTDALTASSSVRLTARIAFMSGFAVSATQLAMPDMGLISYHEDWKSAARYAKLAKSVCFIGDGDTGFGSSGNVRRAVEGYARAGFAASRLRTATRSAARTRVESWLSAGHRAVSRVAAAIAARDEMRAACGLDLVIVARTDCRNAKFIEGGESCEDLFVEARRAVPPLSR